MGVGDVDFWEKVVHGPQVMHRFAAMHHDNQSSFAPDEVDKELEECIYSESLSHIRNFLKFGFGSSVVPRKHLEWDLPRMLP